MKPQQKAKSGNLWLILSAVVVFGLIAWIALQITEKPDEAHPIRQADVRPRTLDPMQFVGKTRDAYQVAMDIPDVLEQMPCFCGCMINAGHKNNLFCFSDTHGVECDMCQNIALDAKQLHSSGLPTDQIREAIRVKYSQSAP